MHGRIGNHDKGGAEHSQSDRVGPQGLGVEAKRAQNGSARHFNVKAVLVVNQAERHDLVDNQALKGIVEDGKLEKSRSVSMGGKQVREGRTKKEKTYHLQPAHRAGNGLMVQ